MKAGATTSGAIALGLLLGLLACKKLKSEEASPAKGTTPEAPTPGPASGTTQGQSDTIELPGVVAIGATAQLNSLKVRVAEVKQCKYEREANQEALKKQGQKLVGVLVYFEGDYESHGVQAHAHTWKAYDEEGITYRIASTHTTDCQPPLKSVNLAKGDKAKGWVAFKVPESIKQLDAKYTHHIPPAAAKEAAKQVVAFRALSK